MSRFTAVLLALAVFYTPGLYGQAGTSFTLQGTLLDPTGAVIPDATVTVKNLSLGVTRTNKTDQQGHYIFAALPPEGQYEISVLAKGFAPQTKRGLTFTSGVDSVVDFNLKPRTLPDTA